MEHPPPRGQSGLSSSQTLQTHKNFQGCYSTFTDVEALSALCFFKMQMINANAGNLQVKTEFFFSDLFNFGDRCR